MAVNADVLEEADGCYDDDKVGVVEEVGRKKGPDVLEEMRDCSSEMGAMSRTTGHCHCPRKRFAEFIHANETTTELCVARWTSTMRC